MPAAATISVSLRMLSLPLGIVENRAGDDGDRAATIGQRHFDAFAHPVQAARTSASAIERRRMGL